MDFKARVAIKYEPQQVDKETKSVIKKIENEFTNKKFKIFLDATETASKLRKQMDFLSNNKIKFALDTSKAQADIDKLLDSFKKPLTKTAIFDKKEYELNEAYLTELKTTQNVARELEIQLAKISAKNKEAFDDTEISKYKKEYESMIAKFNKGLSVDDGVPQFQGQDLTLQRMKSSYAELILKVDSYNQKKKESEKLSKQELAIENARVQAVKMRNNLEKLQVSNEGFLKSDRGKDAVQEIEATSRAIKEYEQSATRLNKLKVDEHFSNLGVAMEGAKKKVFSFTEMLTMAGKKFLTWLTIQQSVQLTMRAIREMTQEVIALDSSIIELQKVSDLYNTSLDNFIDKAYEASAVLGRTGKELIDATTLFKRAGFTLKESFDLGQEALLLQNVGDGIDNVEQASTILISTLKAFNMEASEARSVIDKINQVSNTSAVSFSSLSEGLRIASATFATSGEDIEQLIGMLTATDAVMQDMSTSANALKVINLRLRGIKTDADDLQPSMTKISQAFHDVSEISIFDSNNQLRTMSEILDDLSLVWDDLTLNQKQYLAEQVAGKCLPDYTVRYIENRLNCGKGLRALTTKL